MIGGLTGSFSGAGRPLRALAVLGLSGGAWLAVQIPEITNRYDAVVAASYRLVVAPVQRHVTPPPAAAAPPDIVVAAPIIAFAGVTRPQLPDPMLPAMLVATPPAIPAPAPEGPSVTAAAPAATSVPGFDLAVSAYAQLARGNRRAADALFSAALAAGTDAPQASEWARAQRQLRRRWSGDAYALFRDAGLAGPTASPVLGGGQSGASLSYRIDPLAPRPLAVFGRIYAAHDANNAIDPRSAQAAIGVRWQMRPGISIAAERLVAIGADTRSDWNLRVAAGGERRLGRIGIDGYAEAGARGNGDLYAGGEAHALVGLGAVGPVQLAAGPGVWGSIQSAADVVGRVDIGAGITARLPAGVAVTGVAVTGTWRWRVAGNAAPGSGPALTVGMAF